VARRSLSVSATIPSMADFCRSSSELSVSASSLDEVNRARRDVAQHGQGQLLVVHDLLVGLIGVQVVEHQAARDLDQQGLRLAQRKDITAALVVLVDANRLFKALVDDGVAGFRQVLDDARAEPHCGVWAWAVRAMVRSSIRLATEPGRKWQMKAFIKSSAGRPRHAAGGIGWLTFVCVPRRDASSRRFEVAFSMPRLRRKNLATSRYIRLRNRIRFINLVPCVLWPP